MAPSSRPIVLVVEDLEPLLELSSFALTSAGYEVLAAGSAEQALELVSGRSIDCLVTDVALPGRSGVELAAQLTAERPGLPVLFATGQEDPDVQREIDGSGHAELRKPYLPAAVCDAVAALLADA